MIKTAGIILIVKGAVMLIWGSFSYTKKEKIIDVDTLEISAGKPRQLIGHLMSAELF